MLCSSTRTRTTKSRCSRKALNGLLFCGKHLKIKKKILWKPETLQVDSATRIQKVWRGWMVRHFLELEGSPLKRTDCHNDEELVTLEERSRQHPLNFFSFIENGKRWWFGLDTIFKLMQVELPTNPFTKQPFSSELRMRVRELQDLCWYRKMFRIPETLHDKAIVLVHLLEDTLYETVSYTRFEYMSRLSLLYFTSDIHRHIEARMIERPSTIRRKHLFILESCLTKQGNPDIHTDFLLYQLLSTLLYLLRTTKNKFPLSFIIFGGLQQI